MRMHILNSFRKGIQICWISARQVKGSENFEWNGEDVWEIMLDRHQGSLMEDEWFEKLTYCKNVSSRLLVMKFKSNRFQNDL